VSANDPLRKFGATRIDRIIVRNLPDEPRGRFGR
jgi:hypothetical protein